MTMVITPMLHSAVAMTGFQARLARQALRLTYARAADWCGVSVGSIQRTEGGNEDVTIRTLRKVKTAYERAGVAFSADGRGIALKRVQ